MTWLCLHEGWQIKILVSDFCIIASRRTRLVSTKVGKSRDLFQLVGKSRNLSPTHTWRQVKGLDFIREKVSKLRNLCLTRTSW